MTRCVCSEPGSLSRWETELRQKMIGHGNRGWGKVLWRWSGGGRGRAGIRQRTQAAAKSWRGREWIHPWRVQNHRRTIQLTPWVSDLQNCEGIHFFFIVWSHKFVVAHYMTNMKPYGSYLVVGSGLSSQKCEVLEEGGKETATDGLPVSSFLLGPG